MKCDNCGNNWPDSYGAVCPRCGLPLNKPSAMRSQELFDLMSREHGLTLLDSEMHEIEIVVARMLAADREQEFK